MIADKEWLASLSAGDQVAYNYGRMTNWTIDTVLKVTPTGMIRTEKGKLFKNGYCKGATSWDAGMWLRSVTQDILDQIEMRQLIAKISAVRIDKLSLQQLRQISEALEGAKEAEGSE